MLPPKIEHLYVWIATEDDSQEGIMAAYNQEDRIWMPLIGADEERIEAWREMALAIHKDRNIPVKMIKLTISEVIEEHTPETEAHTAE